MKGKTGFFVGQGLKQTDKTFEVRNPFDDNLVAEVSMPLKGDVEEALDKSSKAFDKTKIMPAYRRSEILEKAANGIKQHRQDLALTICLESGKPMKYAKSEVDRAVTTITLSAEEAGRISGEALEMGAVPPGAGRFGVVKRFPIGPALGITPFNFPLNLVCHKLGPAIASGNTITVKPSRSTPLTAIKLAEIFHEAGAEPGSVNVLPTDTNNTKFMIDDPRTKIVTFTGSPDVGWQIRKRAYKKRVLLELGGNAGVIVEPDCDIDYAVKRIMMGGFAFSGQVCIAVQRVYIHEKVFEQVTERLIRDAEALVIGDPRDENTDIGPMIYEDAAKRVENWVNDAEKRGAKILTGGSRDKKIYVPTILTRVPKDSPVMRKEIFGPVIAVEPYKNFKQAVQMVDDSVYGLQAGVFTKDINRILHAFNNIEAGGIIVNDVPTYRVDSMPYGGVKESGFSREGVKYAIEEMTEMRLLVIREGRL